MSDDRMAICAAAPILIGAAVMLSLAMGLRQSLGLFGVVLGAGLSIGAALACCGSGMAMAVASRPVPAVVRSTALV